MTHIAGKESAADKVVITEEHMHGASSCYPTGAAGVTVTAHADAWTLGNYAEIVPASTITSDFDIHFVNIEGASADGTYELVLYCTTDEIARYRLTTVDVANARVFAPIPIHTKICDKNSQIQAKVMSENAAQADTMTISIHYHTY